MNMITHLLKKDVRHSRGPLAIWLLLVLLQCVLVGSGVHPGDRVMQAIYQTLSGLLPTDMVFAGSAPDNPRQIRNTNKPDNSARNIGNSVSSVDERTSDACSA